MSRWRRVSIDNIDPYVPQNAPIKVPSRTVAFRQGEIGDEQTAASVEDKTTGDSNSNEEA